MDEHEDHGQDDDQGEIAGCGLSASQLVDRQAAWRGLEPARVDLARIDGGFRVRFRHDPGVPETLQALVDAEGRCCGWASWVVADDEGCSVLEVTGPPEGIGRLAAAFGL